MPDTHILILNTELNQWKHAGGNLNLQHTFSEGRKLSIDLDLLWYKDNNPTDYHNTYSDDGGGVYVENQTRSSKLTPINIKVGKVDYSTGLGKNIKLETGVKGTISHFTNDVGVENLQAGGWIPDPGLTAKYDLDEEILAAYASLETPLGKGFTFKGGLRYEYTSSNLGSIEQPDIVDRQFGELFPSLYLSKEFNDSYSINVSYSKRISRPTFNDMAPFVLFLDPYTFFSGNPALQPSIANKYGVSFRMKTIILNLEYALEDSTIAPYQSSVIPGTNRQLVFAENLIDTRTWSGTLSIPYAPMKWWNMYINLFGNYQVSRRWFEGQTFEYESGAFGFFSSQTFTISKSISAELSGFFNAGGLFGTYRVKDIGGVNVGVQKKFGDQGGTLRIGYDDVFNTLRFRAEADIPELNQLFKANLRFNQPTFKIGYSQNFGSQQVKGKRERGTGAEEEKQRISN